MELKTQRKLDKKDIAIIRELDFDARMSISALARKVRVSKEVANYRLKKLLEDKVIKSFTAIIDPYIMGYQLYSLRIKFKHVHEQKKKEIITWVQEHPQSARIMSLGGKWNLAVFFWARNPSEFANIYDEFLLAFGKVIQRKSLTITIRIEHRPYNFLYDKMSEDSLSIGTVGNQEVDNKDKMILDVLSKNCRASLIDIAKITDLTANAVKYRIRNLEEKRIIKGYSTILNDNFFGLAHYRVTLYLSDHSRKKEAKEYLRRQKDVIFITELIGLGDIRFEMLCPSIMRVYELIEKLNAETGDLVRDFDELIILNEEDVFDYFPNE